MTMCGFQKIFAIRRLYMSEDHVQFGQDVEYTTHARGDLALWQNMGRKI
jgi:hypothetical protein